MASYFVIEHSKLIYFTFLGTHPSSRNIQKIENAENTTTIMIIILGFTLLFGRFPLFYNYINDYKEIKLLQKFKDYSPCIQVLTEANFLVVISSNFFIYYVFNNIFRTTFNTSFCHCFCFRSTDTNKTARSQNTQMKNLSTKKHSSIKDNSKNLVASPKETENLIVSDPTLQPYAGEQQERSESDRRTPIISEL